VRLRGKAVAWTISDSDVVRSILRGEVPIVGGRTESLARESAAMLVAASLGRPLCLWATRQAGCRPTRSELDATVEHLLSLARCDDDEAERDVVLLRIALCAIVLGCQGSQSLAGLRALSKAAVSLCGSNHRLEQDVTEPFADRVIVSTAKALSLLVSPRESVRSKQSDIRTLTQAWFGQLTSIVTRLDPRKGMPTDAVSYWLGPFEDAEPLVLLEQVAAAPRELGPKTPDAAADLRIFDRLLPVVACDDAWELVAQTARSGTLSIITEEPMMPVPSKTRSRASDWSSNLAVQLAPSADRSTLDSSSPTSRGGTHRKRGGSSSWAMEGSSPARRASDSQVASFVGIDTMATSSSENRSRTPSRRRQSSSGTTLSPPPSAIHSRRATTPSRRRPDDDGLPAVKRSGSSHSWFTAPPPSASPLEWSQSFRRTHNIPQPMPEAPTLIRAHSQSSKWFGPWQSEAPERAPMELDEGEAGEAETIGFRDRSSSAIEGNSLIAAVGRSQSGPIEGRALDLLSVPGSRNVVSVASPTSSRRRTHGYPQMFHQSRSSTSLYSLTSSRDGQSAASWQSSRVGDAPPSIEDGAALHDGSSPLHERYEFPPLEDFTQLDVTDGDPTPPDASSLAKESAEADLSGNKGGRLEYDLVQSALKPETRSKVPETYRDLNPPVVVEVLPQTPLTPPPKDDSFSGRTCRVCDSIRTECCSQ
jgi:hypothetical protein